MLVVREKNPHEKRGIHLEKIRPNMQKMQGATQGTNRPHQGKQGEDKFRGKIHAKILDHKGSIERFGKNEDALKAIALVSKYIDSLLH